MTHCYSENGEALAFAGGYGALTRHEVLGGQILLVDQALLFAVSEGTELELGLPGSCISCCFGGEGLVYRIKGPCSVYTANRNSAVWNAIINPPQPKRKEQLEPKPEPK